jgi:MoxR-like ATPase
MQKEDIQSKISSIKSEMAQKVVGQDNLVRDLLVGLFAHWHILLEWAPGLAKTLAVSTLAKVVNLDFQRIQFTPDLLPSDLTGAKIYNPEKKDFFVRKGPIFSNLILADEINRAPSKVQSALLEAMAEKQVTIWDETYILDEPFMVLATQNPLEQDGTYSLPEAQLDRFLLKTVVEYPSESEEIEIMKKFSVWDNIKIKKVLTKAELSKMQKEIEKVHVDDNIFSYVKDLIFCSRDNEEVQQYLLYWASPRASIGLIKTAKVLAFLSGRDFVIPEDIKEMALPVLRHRIILSYESVAEWVTPDDVIQIILDTVPTQ